MRVFALHGLNSKTLLESQLRQYEMVRLDETEINIILWYLFCTVNLGTTIVAAHSQVG